MNLLQFPVEICYQVLGFLDYLSITRCREVCKKLKLLVDESSLLQYILELAIAGNEDGEHCPWPAAEKLSALRSHQRGWDKLKWNRELQYPMEDGNIWELFGNVLAQRNRAGWLMFRQLPSRSRGIEEREWKVKPQIRVRDMGMDPSQDLLVLVEAPRWWGPMADRSYRFHIKTLSGCEKHPLSTGDGILVHRQIFPDPNLSYTIQVSGKHLGILLNSFEVGENELLVWNWQTGALLLYLTGDEIRSFSFLSERRILLAVISISHVQEDFESGLLVVDFEAESSQRKAYNEVLHGCTLALPKLSRTTLPVRLSIRCDPSPTWTPSPDLRAPFHLARYNRVYAVSLSVQTDLDEVEEDEEDSHVVVFFVPQRTLMTKGVIADGVQHKVEWEDWGPNVKLILMSGNAIPTDQVREYSSRTDGMFTVLLYDFNRRMRARDEAIAHNCDLSNLGALPPDETFYVSAPTKIRKIFDEEVTTCMPYRVHTVSLPATDPHCALMCSEDAVIVVDVLSSALKTKRSSACKSFYATLRNVRSPPTPPEDERLSSSDKDFILSILRANPSLRDSRSYLASFGPRPKPIPTAVQPQPHEIPLPSSIPTEPQTSSSPKRAVEPVQEAKPSPIIASILNPVVRRTALVKVQGPFTDVQLESIARGMVYLEKLGLVSVIVVENDELVRDQDDRSSIVEETMRVVSALEKQGARARPVLGAVVRLGPKPGEEDTPATSDFTPPEAHTFASDLVPIRSALRSGEIPVISPFALDSFCRSVRVNANDIVGALARGMAEVGTQNSGEEQDSSGEVDLTPLRLMIINREGGIPSYARAGYPHLLVNLDSEYSHIHDTFRGEWNHTHPTSLSNLALARTCLAYMPPTSSAVMVSHRSQSSLIGNLITNKPAVSSSLPHALLQGNRKLTPHTPTLIRRGLPIRVVRTTAEIDKVKMKALLEQSFGRTLDEKAFYDRLDKTLDFVIIAGDYAGSAIVTSEPDPTTSKPISYLDKFAVLPSHQGDGTVDFLWVALHDESYGLGHPSSANPNGGKEGKGEGRDLVWRSRANNPVNKWYFERSSGHVRMGDWVLFWCDAEKRLKIEQGRRGSSGLSFIEEWEEGRLSRWTEVINQIPSVWKK
ncbi:Amino-acid acetyltransferase, mitochondrial [Marasmius crinis-equi]|uniref:Amino-acid acetyltransferase, mitochondrial n=1 Tax=Marasmius crinis-equi TaxID=585013 RepID=A0ABR3FT09_9AGAR